MQDPTALLEAIHDEAGALRREAGQLRHLIDRARAELDRAAYQCEAARRDRERMLAIAARAHAHGRALDDLAQVLGQRARAIECGP